MPSTGLSCKTDFELQDEKILNAIHCSWNHHAKHIQVHVSVNMPSIGLPCKTHFQNVRYFRN